MNKPQPELKVRSLEQAIELAVAQFPADIVSAGVALENILSVNSELLTASHAYLMRVAAREVVAMRIQNNRDLVRHRRPDSGSAAESKPAYRLSGIVTMEMRRTWLTYAVPRVGKLLGAMNADDLDVVAKYHAALKVSNERGERFFTEVGKWLKKKSGHVVADVLDDADIQGIALKTGYAQ